MAYYRPSAIEAFKEVGINITPESCLLFPVSHCCSIKTKNVKTKSGDEYTAAVIILPMERLGPAVQTVPFGEEAFCTPPMTRSILYSPPSETPDSYITTFRYVLTWEQLKYLREAMKGSTRPRKNVFLTHICEIEGFTKDEPDKIDIARRQYYAYAGGPFDDIELLGMYDSGLPQGNKCTMDDIMTFVIDMDSRIQTKALVQWKATTGYLRA